MSKGEIDFRDIAQRFMDYLAFMAPELYSTMGISKLANLLKNTYNDGVEHGRNLGKEKEDPSSITVVAHCEFCLKKLRIPWQEFNMVDAVYCVYCGEYTTFNK